MTRLDLRWLTLACWLVLPAAPESLSAEPGPAGQTTLAADAEPPRFRRIFAPADDIANWPLGGERFVPVESAQFERLLEAARTFSGRAPAAGVAQITAARYEARLVGDDLLSGEAELDATHASSDSAFLILSPWNQVVHSIAWRDPAQPAIVAGVLPDGRFAALIDRGGALQIRWSLRGQRQVSGGALFALRFPPAPSSKLTLDLPATKQLSVDRGVVLDADGGGESRRRYAIELGGFHAAALRVSERTEKARATGASVRLANSYDFSPRGLDLGAQFRFDVRHDPLERVEFDVDSPLQVVAIRYGELDLPWKTTTSPDGAAVRVSVEFPQPISGASRVLRASAIAPLETGKLFRLPALHPVDLTWQEGTATLRVAHPLVLARLEPLRGRQTRVAPLLAPQSGESIEAQLYSADSAINVEIERPPSRLVADSGLQLSFAPGVVAGQVNVRVHALQGEAYELRADVGPRWRIDSVEGGLPDDVADWTVESSDGNLQRLVIRLSRTLSDQRPLKLKIAGRHSMVVGETFDLRDLQMVHFPQAAPGRRLVGLRAAEPDELQLSGDEELAELEAKSLSAGDRELLGEPLGTVLFAVDAAAGQIRIGTASRRPRYLAAFRLEATAGVSRLEERATVRYAPLGTSLERLLIRVSPRSETEWEWTFAGGGANGLVARRLPVDAADDGAEQWELFLRQPQLEPFEIEARREVPFISRVAASLLSAPEAETQQGTIAIRATAGTGLVIDNRRLKTVVPPPSPAGEVQPWRGAYRYDPERDVESAEPALTLAPAQPLQHESGAWAWSARLDSRYSLSGVAFHVATYRLETAGQRSVKFALGAGCELRSTAIDRAPLPLPTLVDPRRPEFSLELPAGRRFVVVEIGYSAPESLPHYWGPATGRFPVVGIPVLERRWNIELPAGFALADADFSWNGQWRADVDWRARLLGPLASGTQRLAEAADDAFREKMGWNSGRSSAAEAWIRALGASLRQEAKNGDRQTWGALLNAAERRRRHAPWFLLLDKPALAAIGVSSQSAVPTITSFHDGRESSASNAPATDGGNELEPGLAILKQGQLAAIVHDDIVLLTAASQAAEFGNNLQPAGFKNLFALAAGGSADHLRMAKDRGNIPALVPLAEWLPSGGARTPWAEATASDETWRDAATFNRYSPDVGPDGAVRLVVIRQATSWSLGSAIALAGLGIGLWLRGSNRCFWLILAGICGTAALLSPVAWLSVATPLFWASAAGVVAASRRPPADAEPRRSPWTLWGWLFSSKATAAGIVVAAVLTSTWASHGVEPQTPVEDAEKNPRPATGDGPQAGVNEASDKTAGTANSAASGEKPSLSGRLGDREEQEINRVFVPVDGNGRPVGGHVYLSEPFHNELFRRAAKAIKRPREWLISRARYQMTPPDATAEAAPAAVVIKAIYDLHVYEADLRVNLPLGGNGVAIAADGVRVGGRPVDFEREAAGRTISFTVDEVGSQLLEIVLQAEIRQAGTKNRIELAVPPTPTSYFQGPSSLDSQSFEIPSARGAISATGDSWEIPLGPGDQLALEWPAAPAGEHSRATVEVEELFWLRLRPATAVMDVRLKLSVRDGEIQQLKLTPDAGWQWIANPAFAAGDISIRPSGGDPATVEIEFPRPVAGEATVDLSFLATGFSGAGRMRLMRFESGAGRVVERSVAVSLDEALRIGESSANDAQSLSVDEFVSAWGETSDRPSAAWRAPVGENHWELTVYPREPALHCEQTVAMSVDRGQAVWRLSAMLRPEHGYLYQLAAVVPAGFQTDSVNMIADGIPSSPRWTEDQSGRIMISLAAPLTDSQQLILRGRLAIPERGEFELTPPRLVDAQITRSEFRLFRQPAAVVRVALPPDVQTLEPDNGEYDSTEWGSPAGRFVTPRPEEKLSFAVDANQVSTIAVQTIALAREGDSWFADVHCQFEVQGGPLDAIRFEIPASWTEPFEIDRPATISIVDSPNRDRRYLIVRPAQPIDGSYQARIRGSILVGPGQRLQAPDVIPLGVRQSRRYVVLPGQHELQQFEWETVNLESAELPAELAKPFATVESPKVFQVAGERFRATLKAVERAEKPRVVLADYVLDWREDGFCHGTASFDVEPHGASSCLLELPEHFRMIRAEAAQMPARIASAGPRRWRLGLGPPALPQRIVIVFDGRLDVSPNRDGRRRFRLPVLVGLEARQTLWTVLGPKSLGAGQSDDSRTVSSPRQHALGRAKALADMFSAAVKLADDVPPDELAAWLVPYLARYEQAKASWRSSEGEVSSAAAAENFAQIDEILQAALEALPANKLERGGGRNEANLADRRPLESISSSDRPVSWQRFSGATGGVELVYARSSTVRLARRAGPLFALLSVVIGGTIVLRRWPAPIAVRHWAIAGGAFWMIFLTPLAAGGLLAFLGLLCEWRARRRRSPR